MFLPQESASQDCTKEMAIELCKLLYQKLEPLGFYPSLTGGLLYKEGNRKDIDILIYRNRQKVESFETIDIESHLNSVGVEITGYFGFVTKAKWKGLVIDLFNPETSEEAFNEWYENHKIELTK